MQGDIVRNGTLFQIDVEVGLVSKTPGLLTCEGLYGESHAGG